MNPTGNEVVPLILARPAPYTELTDHFAFICNHGNLVFGARVHMSFELRCDLDGVIFIQHAFKPF
jgi:hypothetical protein